MKTMLLLLLFLPSVSFAQGIKSSIPRLDDSTIFIDASHRPYDKGSDYMINKYAKDLEHSTIFVIDNKRILGLSTKTLNQINELDIKSKIVVTDSSSSSGVFNVIIINTINSKE